MHGHHVADPGAGGRELVGRDRGLVARLTNLDLPQTPLKDKAPEEIMENMIDFLKINLRITQAIGTTAMAFTVFIVNSFIIYLHFDVIS